MRCRPRDHPRFRGEHDGFRGVKAITDGSSPLSRGALGGFGGGHGVLRIIPAFAGSTTPGGDRWLVKQDHPRFRGEHDPLTTTSGNRLGSSPLSRGAPRFRVSLAVCGGIIPAFAGSTSGCSAVCWAVTDHPRFRGEHLAWRVEQRGARGSSPLSRGARTRDAIYVAVARIIPAFAGSTTRRARTSYGAADHPRFRGEHSSLLMASSKQGGSSPLSRGALAELSRSLGHRRIIPAFAGSTSTRPPRSSPRRDHPRFRGEHDAVRTTAPVRPGSSPLSRGAPVDRVLTVAGPGIIPAFAGST